MKTAGECFLVPETNFFEKFKFDKAKSVRVKTEEKTGTKLLREVADQGFQCLL